MKQEYDSYLDDFGARLSAASAQYRRPGQRKRSRNHSIATVALGLIVVAGVPAAAVTNVFRPHREPDGLVRLTQPQVIAEGDTPSRGHWQLLASRSDVGFCLEIKVPVHASRDYGTTTGGGCGGPPPGSLTIGTSSGGSLKQNGLAYGMTPESATRVRVKARGVTVSVETVNDDAGLNGRFYVAELSVRTSLGPTSVTTLDAAGKVLETTTIG